jgi:hypothetical protein
MNEFANITDLQALKIFFYVESVILVMLLAIIGFFLRRRDTLSIAREIGVTNAMNSLTDAVNQLKLLVSNLKLQYEIKQPLVEGQLELFRQGFTDNAISIKGMDKRLTTLETEHRLMRCKYPANNITINNNENSE